MASKQLTARVRLNTTQAEKSIDRLVNKINRINNVLNKTSNGSSSQIPKNIKNATTETQKWANALNTVNGKLNGSKSLIKSIGSGLKTLADRYLGVMGMGVVVGTSDAITRAENKLNYINGGDTALTQDAMDKMYASSQKVRMGYTDMMSNVSKSMALAGDSFKGSTDMAIRFQEIMAEAYTLGGAEAQEMRSSMYQLIQALGAGVLAGDELRSVREGAPLAYKEIEKFAQGVYNTEESLKDLASQGKITSDMVVAAIMNAGNKMDSAFAQTEQTFEQTWSQIKNAATRSFTPIAKYLRTALNNAIDNGLIQKFETFFINIAKGVMIVFKIIENVINWIADNWNWLKHIVIAGLSIMIAYFLVTKAVAVASAIATAIAWAIANWQILLVILSIGLLIYAFIMFKTGAIDCCTAVCIALLAIAIICFFIFGWVVALIVAAIAVVVWAFEYVCWLFAFLAAIIVDILSFIWNIVWYIIQAIVTAVVWLVATILNIIIGVLNAIIQALWTAAEPFIGIIEWILNVCNGGFNSFGGAVANLIGQIISWFLSLGKVVTKIIDAIFGTNWTDGLNALQDKVLSWGKDEENSITLSREAPTINRIEATEWAGSAWNGMDGLHTGYVNPLDWGGAAYDWGSGVKDSVNNWGSQFQSSGTENGSWMDKMANSLGIDTSEFDNLFNPNSIGSDYGDLLGDTGDIAGNTGKMADAMELTEEDLKYLRSIAEMEWKKEYTTAEIKVEMTNNNNINGESDLDGIVTKLSDKLYEELNIIADGVYAY